MYCKFIKLLIKNIFLFEPIKSSFEKLVVHKVRNQCSQSENFSFEIFVVLFLPTNSSKCDFYQLKIYFINFFIIYTSLDKFMNINLQLWISNTTPSSATAPPPTPTPHWCWQAPCHNCVSPYCNFFLFSQ